MTSLKKNTEELAGLLGRPVLGPQSWADLAGEIPEKAAESFIRQSQGNEALLPKVRSGQSLVGAGLIRMLDWDSEFFGFPTARIEFLAALGNNSARFKAASTVVNSLMTWCAQREVRLVSTKMPGPDPITVQALIQAGFYVTDCGVSLRRPQNAPTPEIKIPTGFSLWTGGLDPDRAAEFFDRLFFDGRFHNDRNIGTELADRLWKTAIRNQLAGEAREVFFLNGPDPAALCTFRPIGAPEERLGSLFIMGVREPFRHQGFGRALLSRALPRLDDKYDFIDVETSSYNNPALRLYQSMGFRMNGLRLSLHCWPDRDKRP